jgi:small-conductance mechanosensitive channel
MPADIDSPPADDAADSQAVKARISPWWILGAVLFVIAVLLGFRSVRKAKSKRAEKAAEGAEPGADEPSA